MADSKKSIPVEVVFNPNWWNKQYGIVFDRSFYFNKTTRINNDLLMRQTMVERFGLGEPDPRPCPVIGSRFVAGGFVVPALFGVKIRFWENEAPTPTPLNMSNEAVSALKAPNVAETWPMDLLIADMDSLEKEFGSVEGDFDTDGILNTALHLRGMQLFTDFKKNPELVHHLFSVITETTLAVSIYMKRRTGTSAVATNRSILNVDPQIYLHSNCSVQMISPATYEEFLLPHEMYLAECLPPYGIHHCGNNLHRYTSAYSKIPAVFFDVGWGSDVAQCRDAFPQAFLNLRLSPMDMLWKKPEEIREITMRLLAAGYSPGRTGVCCVNMDHGTPDENVMAMIEAAENYRMQ
jgi:uroporphyrinogen-III decarboxylase